MDTTGPEPVMPYAGKEDMPRVLVSLQIACSPKFNQYGPEPGMLKAAIN